MSHYTKFADVWLLVQLNNRYIHGHDTLGIQNLARAIID